MSKNDVITYRVDPPIDPMWCTTPRRERLFPPRSSRDAPPLILPSAAARSPGLSGRGALLPALRPRLIANRCACSCSGRANLQSLQRFCLPPPGGGQPILRRLQYLNRKRMRFIIRWPAIGKLSSEIGRSGTRHRKVIRNCADAYRRDGVLLSW